MSELCGILLALCNVWFVYISALKVYSFFYIIFIIFFIFFLNRAPKVLYASESPNLDLSPHRNYVVKTGKKSALPGSNVKSSEKIDHETSSSSRWVQVRLGEGQVVWESIGSALLCLRYMGMVRKGRGSLVPKQQGEVRNS